jgi:hypothetical protein
MQEHNMCCIYHVKIDELWIGLNNMQKIYQVCNHSLEDYGASSIFYKGITSLWEPIVCPKGELMEWHKNECLYGKSLDCGIQKFFFCLIGLSGPGSNLLKWRRFALEEIKSKNGKPLKKLTLFYKKISSDEMMDYLKPKL